jgi:hypothetical protein
MPTEACRTSHQVRTIAPLPAGFRATPEWHRARAAFVRWLDEPDARYLSRHHEILARLIEHRRRFYSAKPCKRKSACCSG